jgi:N-acetylneuraminic acid mutarotase
MQKRLFNFYLDDETKNATNEKLERLIGEKPKGALAALIRVMLKKFVAMPDDKVSQLFIAAIEAEYEYSTKLNKRSKN